MQVDSLGITILIGTFFVLLLIRVPVAFSLGIASVVTAWYLDLPLMIVAQQMTKGLNSFSLMAIPFFILAGQLMGIGGISQRMIDMANVFVGRIRGGLAMVNILASMLFGGISGSSVADTSSIGSILIPMMKKAGYDNDYSVAVTITSSVQGVIIPPSHNVIIYALAAGWVAVRIDGVTKQFALSIGKLFLAGVIPGVFFGIMLMSISYYLAVKRNYPKEAPVGFQEGVHKVIDGFFGLMTAVIIIGGVVSGVFTATESAAIAVAYAFLVTWLIYHEITWKNLYAVLYESLKTLAIVAALITTSSAYGYMMTRLDIPRIVTESLIQLTDNRYLVFLIVNVILLFLGMIMDMAPLILITTPILLPVVANFGMDPHHFGIVMMINLGMGLLTPPVGSTLFVGCAIGRVRIEDMVKPLIPFYVTMFITLMLITYIPQISLWLPSLVGK
jgi:tripartite ATP-independent transporter DctM subunit